MKKTLFFVSIIIFGLQQLLPGDPALALADEENDPAVVQAIREQYNLDKDPVLRFGHRPFVVRRRGAGRDMRRDVQQGGKDGDGEDRRGDRRQCEGLPDCD